MATFGMIGTFTAHAGKGDELLEVMREGAVDMDGCELYVVGRSAEDPDTLCIAELWRDAEAHAASLRVEQVRATIDRAMPLIASMSGTRFEPVLEFTGSRDVRTVRPPGSGEPSAHPADPSTDTG